MTILETVAVFVGGPLVIYAGIAAFTVLPNRAKARPRYTPGQAWDYPPQWWAGDTPVLAVDAPGSDDAKGGARGTW
ncbi:hypothetical protein GIS00_05895 [Nakamurella sp. YIM 132087]|uniref:Uncharacterized protein n=1 Tax=Nakamurella alba TaxID=2665158 RepID=A0A7K1FHD8_9ACTN|nr:hypothetical protein [Nakamurella alba]MTD13476.1 hypothetical protein [Nakamurella alba]